MLPVEKPISPRVDPYTFQIANAAKTAAYVVEDVGGAILAFIPNGLELVYDKLLKSLPVIGVLFARPWVEQALKLVCGITIGQGIAADLAYFLFRPVGFTVGTLIGALSLSLPPYHGQVGKLGYRLSGQTVGGALLGLLVLSGGIHLAPAFFGEKITLLNALGWVGIGGLLGLIGKSLFLLAVHVVNTANGATIRKNVQRAKELNKRLKKIAKQQAKSRILRQAQDIIQQINGPQAQGRLEEFFKTEYDTIAASTHYKIDRHFDYLTDRACHGDLRALKRLQSLFSFKRKEEEMKKSPLDHMLDRIFNARAIAKIKDEVDTSYDRWHYQFLRTV